MNKNDKQKIDFDRKLIERLGGSVSLAARLGYTVQRVHNWKTRGVPALVKINHPDIFLNNRRTEDEVP